MEKQRGRIKIVPTGILLLAIVGLVYWLSPSLFSGTLLSPYKIMQEDGFGIKGEVKSYYTADHEAMQKFGEWGIGGLRKESFGGSIAEGYAFQQRSEYDEKGNQVSHTISMDGELSSVYEFEYDEDRKLLKEVEKGRYGEIETVKKVVRLVDSKKRSETEYYKYDSKGKLTWKDVEVIELGNDGLMTRMETTSFSPSYSGSGELSIFSKSIQDDMKYDEGGKLIFATMIVYDEEGGVKNEAIFQIAYNESGEMVSQSTKKPDGTIVSSNLYECIKYDEVGNCIYVLCTDEMTGEKYIKLRSFEYY